MESSQVSPSESPNDCRVNSLDVSACYLDECWKSSPWIQRLPQMSRLSSPLVSRSFIAKEEVNSTPPFEFPSENLQLAEALHVTNEKLKEIQNEFVKAKTENSNIFHKLRKELAEQQSAFKNLKQNLAATSKENHELKGQLSSLKSYLSQLPTADEATTLKRELDIKNQVNANFVSRENLLKNHYDATKQRVLELQLEVDTYQSKIESLTLELAKERTANEQQQRRFLAACEADPSRVVAITDEKNRLAAENEALKARLLEIEKVHAEEKSQLLSKVEEKDYQTKQKDDLMNHLQTELNETKCTVNFLREQVGKYIAERDGESKIVEHLRAEVLKSSRYHDAMRLHQKLVKEISWSVSDLEKFLKFQDQLSKGVCPDWKLITSSDEQNSMLTVPDSGDPVDACHKLLENICASRTRMKKLRLSLCGRVADLVAGDETESQSAN